MERRDTRWRGLIVLGAAAAVAALAMPAAASASTVSVSGSTLTYADPAGAPNENNALTIAPGEVANTFDVTDPAATITAGSGCVGGGIAGAPVMCSAPGLRFIVIQLAEGNDTADTSATAVAIADTYNGGEGTDGIAYSAASAAVIADPDGNADDGRDTNNDGVADEMDAIGTDVENLTGGGGNDTLTGSNTAANVLTGAGGGDQLNGLLLDDTLIGEEGNDAYDGGGGTDKVSFAGAASGVSASLADGTAAGEGSDVFAGVENLTGGAFDDALTGNGDGNTLEGGSGVDTLIGGGGGDALRGGNDNDAGGSAGVFGGAGNDNLQGNNGDDLLDGGDNVDVLNGNTGNDTLAGGNDTDTLNGGDDNDTLDGGPGDDAFNGGNQTVPGGDTASFANAPGPVDANLTTGMATGSSTDTLSGVENLAGSGFADTLTGNTGDNAISGGAGMDALNGDDGADTLHGGEDGDVVNGGAGHDKNNGAGVFGDDGDDTLNGNSGDDHLSGGDDTDLATFTGATGGVEASLVTEVAIGDGTDTMSGIEDLAGTGFDDELTGNGGANQLEGEGGVDEVRGGAGTDTLDGGEGDDEGPAGLVNGGGGDDALAGGGGDDRLEGDDGNDTLNGNGGDDFLDGGINTDTASFAGAPGPGGVTASLTTGTATGDGADGMIDVENLSGTGFADDLTGKAGEANILAGLGGADVLRVRDGGPDTADCGSEADTALIDTPPADTVNDCELFDPPGLPATPAITGSDASTPGNDNSPEIKGAADAGATVSLYTSSDCTGVPVATGTGAAFASPGLTISVADDSSTTLRAKAFDTEGGESSCSAAFTYVEDSTPPQTTIATGPVQGATVADAKPTFTFGSSEAGSGFQCRYDGRAFGPCSGPGAAHTPARRLRDGTHTFDVRALDAAGNPDPSAAARKFSVDTAGPRTRITNPKTKTRDRTPTFSFQSSEAGVRFACSMDGDPFARCVSPFTSERLAFGRHRFRVRAVDSLGNVGRAARDSFNVRRPRPEG